MDSISGNLVLAKLVDQYPLSSRVLLKYGLDFCCGGKNTVAQACEAREIDLDMVISDLGLCKLKSSNKIWSSASNQELITHILDSYHAPLHENLPHLVELLSRVEKAHAPKYKQLFIDLAQTILNFSSELIDHMAKEEQILFPWILANRQPRPIEPIHCMKKDHQIASAFLTKLTELTNNYQPPKEACTTWKSLYTQLQLFDHELRNHIHLENNILFPRFS
ncbi:MAG: iron-sulfur cluster repair di-iron protein [Prochlorococcus sp.]